MTPTLQIPAAVLADVRRWARAELPREACGLLVGPAPGPRPGPGSTVVRRAVRARNANVERACDRYEVEPADHLAAWKAARADGLEIVGVWHSHPAQPARPSATDREAAWEGWSYLIVAFDPDEEARSWRLDGGDFVEERIHAGGGYDEREPGAPR